MLQRVHLIAASRRTAMLSRQPATVSADWCQQTMLPHLAAGLGKAQVGKVCHSGGMPRLQQQRTVTARAAAPAGGRRDARGDRYAALSGQQAATAARGGARQTQDTGTRNSRDIGGSDSDSNRAARPQINPRVLQSRLSLMRLLPVQQFKAVGVSFDDRQDRIPQLHKGELLLLAGAALCKPCMH